MAVSVQAAVSLRARLFLACLVYCSRAKLGMEREARTGDEAAVRENE